MFSQKIIFVSAEIFRVLFAELGKINTFLGKKYEKTCLLIPIFHCFPPNHSHPRGPRREGDSSEKYIPLLSILIYALCPNLMNLSCLLNPPQTGFN